MFDIAQGLFLHLALREVNLTHQVYSLMMFSGNHMTAIGNHVYSLPLG